MASSAYVKWRVVAAAVSLAFFFILSGVAEMIDNVFRVNWGHVIDPALGGHQVWCALLASCRRRPVRGVGAGTRRVGPAARPGRRTQAAAVEVVT